MLSAKSRVFLFIFSTFCLCPGLNSLAWKKLSNLQTFDVAVLGATPGGIAAAIQAARLGMKVALIDRNKYPGRDFQSLPFLESHNEGGFYKEFSDSLKHALQREGETFKDYPDATFYSPKIAGAVWEELIQKENNISLFRSFQFDPVLENTRNPSSGKPKQIRIFNTKRPGKSIWVEAKIWIDGTREGDLAAAFGCRIRTGGDREGEFNLTNSERVRSLNIQFSSPGDTVVWNVFSNTKATIQFGLRRNPKKISVRKPEEYQREEYTWLTSALRNGLLKTFFTEDGSAKSLFQTASSLAGIYTLKEWVSLPQILVTKASNYSNLTWNQRDSIQAKARHFVQGLLWFAQNDTSLAVSFREEALQFGLPKSEFRDSDHLPPDILLTFESRVECKMIFTEREWTEGYRQSSLIQRNSVALGSIKIKKEGNPEFAKIRFMVPFETIVPADQEQILCPVPFFATDDVARNPAMDAVRIQLGQAAGVAAAMAIRKNIIVSKVPVDSIQTELIRMKATIGLAEDVPASDPDYGLVQKAALLGWFAGNSALLNAKVEQKDIELWSARSGFSQKEISELAGNSKRRDALNALMKKYQDQWKAKL